MEELSEQSRRIWHTCREIRVAYLNKINTECEQEFDMDGQRKYAVVHNDLDSGYFICPNILDGYNQFSRLYGSNKWPQLEQDFIERNLRFWRVSCGASQTSHHVFDCSHEIIISRHFVNNLTKQLSEFANRLTTEIGQTISFTLDKTNKTRFRPWFPDEFVMTVNGHSVKSTILPVKKDYTRTTELDTMYYDAIEKALDKTVKLHSLAGHKDIVRNFQ